MTAYFFCGSLRHPPLLETVLGREIAAGPAAIADHRMTSGPDGRTPALTAAPGAVTEGVLVEGLTPGEKDRLDYFRTGYAASLRSVTRPDGEEIDAVVYLAPAPRRPVPWRYEDWAGRWGPLATAAAEDIMKGYGHTPAARAFARYPQILIRADSRLRARAQPHDLRGTRSAGDVRPAERREPYAHYFSVEEYDLSWRRFDGSFGAPETRAVFLAGDAATVMPYDPVRDRVLLVEQFRPGPWARGDLQPWLLEPVAGRIDPGETPQSTAIREAREEAGVELGELIEVARYYSSPGGVGEFIFAYVAIADLPDGTARTAGLPEEGEDIRGHLLGFEELMALVASGESGNAPLVVSAWWLALNRERLRAGR